MGVKVRNIVFSITCLPVLALVFVSVGCGSSTATSQSSKGASHIVEFDGPVNHGTGTAPALDFVCPNLPTTSYTITNSGNGTVFTYGSGQGRAGLNTRYFNVNVHRSNGGTGCDTIEVGIVQNRISNSLKWWYTESSTGKVKLYSATDNSAKIDGYPGSKPWFNGTTMHGLADCSPTSLTLTATDYPGASPPALIGGERLRKIKETKSFKTYLVSKEGNNVYTWHTYEWSLTNEFNISADLATITVVSACATEGNSSAGGSKAILDGVYANEHDAANGPEPKYVSQIGSDS